MGLVLKSHRRLTYDGSLFVHHAQEKASVVEEEVVVSVLEVAVLVLVLVQTLGHLSADQLCQAFL